MKVSMIMSSVKTVADLPKEGSEDEVRFIEEPTSTGALRIARWEGDRWKVVEYSVPCGHPRKWVPDTTPYHLGTRVGTCSICGGPVSVPSVWYGVTPPVPTCEHCGAVRQDSYGPVIPMKPAPRTWTGTKWTTAPTWQSEPGVYGGA